MTARFAEVEMFTVIFKLAKTHRVSKKKCQYGKNEFYMSEKSFFILLSSYLFYLVFHVLNVVYTVHVRQSVFGVAHVYIQLVVSCTICFALLVMFDYLVGGCSVNAQGVNTSNYFDEIRAQTLMNDLMKLA